MLLWSDPYDDPRVMHTRFPATMMALGMVNNEGHVMPSHLFPQGLRISAIWGISLSLGEMKFKISVKCDNLYDYETPNIRPVNSPG